MRVEGMPGCLSCCIFAQISTFVPFQVLPLSPFRHLTSRHLWLQQDVRDEKLTSVISTPDTHRGAHAHAHTHHTILPPLLPLLPSSLLVTTVRNDSRPFPGPVLDFPSHSAHLRASGGRPSSIRILPSIHPDSFNCQAKSETLYFHTSRQGPAVYYPFGQRLTRRLTIEHYLCISTHYVPVIHQPMIHDPFRLYVLSQIISLSLQLHDTISPPWSLGIRDIILFRS